MINEKNQSAVPEWSAHIAYRSMHKFLYRSRQLCLRSGLKLREASGNGRYGMGVKGSDWSRP